MRGLVFFCAPCAAIGRAAQFNFFYEIKQRRHTHKLFFVPAAVPALSGTFPEYAGWSYFAGSYGRLFAGLFALLGLKPLYTLMPQFDFLIMPNLFIITLIIYVLIIFVTIFTTALER